MASVALTFLMATIELEFPQSILSLEDESSLTCCLLKRKPRVPLRDEAAMKSRVPLRDEAALKSFFRSLSSLQVFLEYHGGGGAAIKYLETKIRDFALKAEDDIEIQLRNFLLAKDRRHKKKASRKLRQTLQEAAENAAELLKIINSTRKEAKEANETQPSISWLKHASESANVKSDGSSWHSPKLEGRMVGRCGDYRAIKDLLLCDPDGLSVISIVGMMGIGKTTLARSVYGDPEVASHFEVQCWITIPREYNESQVLCDLLRSITQAKPNVIKKGHPFELAREVYKCLKGWRYLIVLDNLWNNQTLSFKQCFPNDKNGSCILLTTMHFHRNYIDGYSSYIHKMTLLDPNESWDLFCNILSLEEHTAPQFEKIRSNVVEKCEGLPQSIVAVAERLLKCNNIQQEWKKIEKELESLGTLDCSVLSLRYNQLPQHLKCCFLYLGIFPKRSEIPVKMLIRLWMAEGFLKPLEYKKLKNLAQRYLQELFDRSFVFVSNRGLDGKIKTCKMHGAMHTFCVREVQKEGIFCAVDIQRHPGLSLHAFANSSRWLSLYTHSFDYYVLFRTNYPRSIFFFNENPETFVPSKLLRVLAFVPPPFLQRVQMQLGDLAFLRYLHVTQWFEGLDDIVSSNPNLQTLVVSSDESQLGAPALHLPSKLWESPWLRHLELGSSYTIDPPSMVKENLQTLSWVSPTHCKKEVSYRFPNIKKLKFYVKDDLELPIILDNLDYVAQLEKLTISVLVGCIVTLPERSKFPFLLEKLSLRGTNLSVRNITLIGMLHQLKVLKLKNVFLGKVWEVAEGGFPQLVILLLEAKNLEKLMATKYSFPCLQHLVLRFCYCLEEIPRGFADIVTLRSIELERCRPSVVAAAKQIREGLHPLRSRMFEIKTHGPEYDESQYTHIEESREDDLARRWDHSELTVIREMV